MVAWEFLKRCDVIFVPRARTKDHSVARQCLPPNEIPGDRFREVEFTMDSDREKLREHYAQLAAAISVELHDGKDAAWLTIGDPMTYSTYIYMLAALKDCMPDCGRGPIPASPVIARWRRRRNSRSAKARSAC